MAVDMTQVKQAIQESFILDEWVRDMAEDKTLDVDAELILSCRGKMWNIFAEEVASHIEHYTVKQYKDFPDDQATSWTEEDMVKQMQKYINRINSNERGDIERNRDLMKIAHYVQMIWSKRLGFEDAFREVLEERANEKPVEESTNA